MCREKFDIVRRKTEDLAAALARLDATQAVDMDEAGMRLTLDVVGLVSSHTCITCIDFTLQHQGCHCNIGNLLLLESCTVQQMLSGLAYTHELSHLND